MRTAICTLFLCLVCSTVQAQDDQKPWYPFRIATSLLWDYQWSVVVYGHGETEEAATLDLIANELAMEDLVEDGLPDGHHLSEWIVANPALGPKEVDDQRWPEGHNFYFKRKLTFFISFGDGTPLPWGF